MSDQQQFETFLARLTEQRDTARIIIDRTKKSSPAQMAARVFAAALLPERQLTKVELARLAGYPMPRVAARLLSRETLEGKVKK